PRTVLDTGSTVNFHGTVLVTDPGQTSVLSGGGNWHIATDLAGFQGGTVNLADGAVLKGAPSLFRATLNGDADVTQDFALPGEFGSETSPRMNFMDASVLNGKVLLGVPDLTPAGLFFANGSRLDGNADIEFGPGTFGNV